MRLHTALHLLGAVVKAPVTGGRIAADKAHLDFDIEMEKLVKEELEARVNASRRTGSKRGRAGSQTRSSMRIPSSSRPCRWPRRAARDGCASSKFRASTFRRAAART